MSLKIPTRFRKSSRKSHYAGLTTALLALGGIAAFGMRNPQVRERARELKDALMRRLSPMAPPARERAALAAANQPY